MLLLCVLFCKEADIMIAGRTDGTLMDNMRSVHKDMCVFVYGGVCVYIQLLCEVSCEFPSVFLMTL